MVDMVHTRRWRGSAAGEDAEGQRDAAPTKQPSSEKKNMMASERPGDADGQRKTAPDEVPSSWQKK